MKVIDLLHRWTGGLIGLLLAVLGLSGAILVHKDAWIMLPHADDAQVQDVARLSATVTRLTADPQTRADSILFASPGFGLDRLRFGKEAGAYTDQAGSVVTRWDSKWERVELWLFDLHHYLLAGKTGATVAGVLALIGMCFVVTGVILWWPLRKTFKLRPWPSRMSRPAIVRQHRDLGVVIAPVLFLSLLTGVMMTLPPVSRLLLSPWSSSEVMDAASAKADAKGGALANGLDWMSILTQARNQFPTAEFRLLALPSKPGDLIALRMKQPQEWLPNGRTMLWFAPEDGRLIETRDALKLPMGTRISNLAYPVHAAKVGGISYRLVMTASGLSLTMLGSLSVWAFWFWRKPRALKDSRAAPFDISEAGSANDAR